MWKHLEKDMNEGKPIDKTVSVRIFRISSEN